MIPRRFLREEDGSILPIFAVMFAVILLGGGAAIDAARIHHSRTRLAAAADVAAVAAGRSMLDGGVSSAEIKRLASQYFRSNLNEAVGYVSVKSFDVEVDFPASSVEVKIRASVPMTLSRIAGFESVELPITSIATFGKRELELALALDVTGSMRGAKIDALKAATLSLVDQIFQGVPSSSSSVRVALAPYSSGVNAGSFAQLVVDGRIANGCVFERQGAVPEGDQAPGPGDYLRGSNDAGGAGCPSATVVPLTSDKAMLKASVSSYVASGTTAGHTGAQWAFYLISPYWAGVFGSAHAPSEYDGKNRVKAAIIMTDGENNTFNGAQDRGASTVHRDRSDQLELEICSEMKKKGVLVFTIAFTADSAPLDGQALELLQGCASEPERFFPAADARELARAFSLIGKQLSELRLSK